MKWLTRSGLAASVAWLLLSNGCTVDIWPTAQTNNPTTPAKPLGLADVSGSESYYYAYGTYAFDPDNDKLAYQFRINADVFPAIDVWSSYFSSGDTVIFITQFLDYGDRASIYARVKDTQRNISNWSEPLLVNVRILWDVQLRPARILQGAYFFDVNNGWAVGSYGTILNTNNAGGTWYGQSSGTTETLSSVSFVNAKTGWTVGSSGTILKTTDGGSIWHRQSSGTTRYLSSVCFIDANTGWAVGDSGTILKTTNGGTSWARQTSGTTYRLNSVFFIDSKTGWVVGSYWRMILKTTNGGSSWYEQEDYLWGEELYSLCFIVTTQRS